MNKNFDIKHWLSLSLVTGVGSKTLRALLTAYESPGAVLRASVSELRRHVSETVASAITSEDRSAAVAAALKWQAEDGNMILTMADSEYPQQLLETADPPPLLYARGNLTLLQQPLVAIVGSRSASPVGVRNTEIFARALSDAGCGVVSGLAQGVDTAAHRGALLGAGSTVAVVGTGMDIVYPRANRTLAAEISQQGLLLSEFALGTKPLASNFPRRNRIISGLSRACLVVEAALKSGSLITANLAAEQGREVFAVPGSINAPLHRGCHQLIKQGAKLAENVNDILEELSLTPVTPSPATEEQRYEENRTVGMQQADSEVIVYINYQPTSIDDIAARSGVAVDALMPALLELEVGGKIVALAGGSYQRV
ncbi:MAG: DNA-processing protein DprA [Proteobacteria bacterium]|nr:DNA-processing protein DprA [Pseudomonadota bacterium]MCH9758942.1 DNA-processing protein DprA [Pseudomonadota bacterium]